MLKINNYIHKNIIFLISLLLMLQPIIDTLIGLSIEYNYLTSFTFIFRFSIFAFFLYYFIFIYRSPLKKYYLLLLGIIATYILMYFIHMDYNISELKIAIRVFYLPIIFIILNAIFGHQKQLLDKKIFLIALGTYSFIILLSFITNTAFNSYDAVKLGQSGYFHAANEIGAIIAILLPFTIDYLANNITTKKILYFLLVVIAILILGTKTPFISLVICMVVYLFKFINNKNILKLTMLSIVSIIFFGFLLTLTPIYKNLIIHLEYLKIDNIKELIFDINSFDHFFLGSRFRLFIENTMFYLDNPINYQLFGVGYLNYSKLIEMDFFDILYRQGLIGFSLYFIPIIYLFNIYKKYYNAKYTLSIILIVLVAGVVGHVLVAPAVSIFVATILALSIGGRENES
ncbi:MAG: O-antigen ligase family protein [Bacilli bacterium]